MVLDRYTKAVCHVLAGMAKQRVRHWGMETMDQDFKTRKILVFAFPSYIHKSGSFTRAVLFGEPKSLLARYSSFDALERTGIQWLLGPVLAIGFSICPTGSSISLL